MNEIITNDVLSNSDYLMYGKYNNIIRYVILADSGNISSNMNEKNSWWGYFYEARHYPYKNIASGEKPYDLGLTYEGGSTDRIWVLYKIIVDYIRLYLLRL